MDVRKRAEWMARLLQLPYRIDEDSLDYIKLRSSIIYYLNNLLNFISAFETIEVSYKIEIDG